MPSLRIALLLPLLLGLSSRALAAPDASGRIWYVTDGDTFRLTSGERIRIADIDAPETHRDQAKCPVEIRRGLAASIPARALLAGRDITFVRTGQSYNRTVARVRLNGKDVGTQLIAMGVARPWLRHHPKPDWCG